MAGIEEAGYVLRDGYVLHNGANIIFEVAVQFLMILHTLRSVKVGMA